MTERKLLTTWAPVPLDKFWLLVELGAAMNDTGAFVINCRYTKDGNGVDYFVEEPHRVEEPNP